MLCNHCNFEFPTGKETRGTDIPCPKCGAFVTVTDAGVTLHCPLCSKPFETPAWTVGSNQNCPHCGEILMISKGCGMSGTGGIAPGMLLGQYRIEKHLAFGAAGDVFLATHEIHGTRCAIKILKDTQDAPFEKNAARVIREAKRFCKLRHPNILSFYDANISTNGRTAYIVMEYADGGSVLDLIRKGPMSVDAALSIVKSVAEALVAAEKFGVVHQDIKPDNILLTSEGEVKLSNLGISADASRLTMDHRISGMPNYTSPEQLTDSHEADSRSDIYSLGATLYHMLAGQPPYGDGDAINVIKKVLAGPPDPLENLNPNLPPAAAALVRRMMAHSANERIASADLLLSELSTLDLTMPEREKKTTSAPVRRKSGVTSKIKNSLRSGSFPASFVSLLTAFVFVGGFFVLRWLSTFQPVFGDPDAPVPGLCFFPLVFWLIWLSFGFHSLRLVNAAYASSGDDFGALAFGPIAVFSKWLERILYKILKMIGIRISENMEPGNVVFKNSAGQKVVVPPGLGDATAYRSKIMLRYILTNAMIRNTACIMITQERGDRAAARFSFHGVLKTFLKFKTNICNSLIMLLEQMAGPPDPASGARILFAEIGELTYRFKIKTVHSDTGNQATVWLCVIHGDRQLLEDSGMFSDDVKRLQHILSLRSGLIFLSGPHGAGKRTTASMLLRAAKRFGSAVWIGDGDEPDFPDRYVLTPSAGRSRLDLMRLVCDRAFVVLSKIETDEEMEAAVRMANNNQMVIVITESEPLDIFMRAKNAGIPASDFVSAFRAIISQRVLRTLCFCAKQTPVPKQLQRKWVEYSLPAKGLRMENGCLDCEDSGLSGGTVAVFDVMEMYPALRKELESHLYGTHHLEQCMEEAGHGVKALECFALDHAAAGHVSARELGHVFPDGKGDL